jgi:hypothetical protein
MHPCIDCAAPSISRGRCSKCYNRHRYLTKIKTNPVAMQAARDRRNARRANAKTYAVDNACDMRQLLKRKFRLTLEAYCKLLVEQNSVCAICGRVDADKRLAVDHCHATGTVRGLLCQNCNQGLGKFRDRPEDLRAAAAYLLRTPPDVPPFSPGPTRGQQRGARSSHARLTDEQVREVRASRPRQRFAFDVSRSMVSRIRKGLSYRSVP